MAYPHTEYEVVMLTSVAQGAASKVTRANPFAVSVLATGKGSQGSANWSPGFMPHVIRNVGVIVLGTGAFVTKPVISIRATAAGASQTVSGQQITTLTLTSAAGTKASATSGRSVFYKSSLLNSTVNPGTDIRALVTTKATIGPSRTSIRIVLYVEPKWETPGNVSNMKTA